MAAADSEGFRQHSGLGQAFGAVGTRVALYMPGVTIVPPEGLSEEDADQQLARLRSAIIEIDTQLGALAAGQKS
jgi:hypothetical protein